MVSDNMLAFGALQAKLEMPELGVGGKEVGAPRGGTWTAEWNICPIQP